MIQPARPALRAASILLAGFVLLFAASGASARADDRANAVDCEALVQTAYWDLRNEGHAGTFPLVQYREVLATRAERTARMVSYLRAQRGRDLSQADLQGEIDRLGRDTQAPQALAKVFKALGNDPQLIGECLAKPVLVDRLARQYFAQDTRVHGPVATRAQLALDAAIAASATPVGASPARLPLITAELDERVANPAATGAEKALVRTLVEHNVAQWQIAPATSRTRWSRLHETETEFTALRGDYRDGKLELRTLRWPKQRLDAWWTTASASYAPDFSTKAPHGLTLPQLASGEIAHWSRMRDHDTYPLGSEGDRSVVVATGSEVLIWGGLLSDDEQPIPSRTSNGLAYNPTTDSWHYIPAVGAPTQFCGTTLGLWTGNKLLVFVGNCEYWPAGSASLLEQPFQVALYDPVANAWTPVAPPPADYRPSFGFTAVWTGSKAILYGGTNTIGRDDVTHDPTNQGASFDPATGLWTPFTISPAQVGLPSSERTFHQAIWAGTTMYVFGGGDDAESCGASLSAFAFNPFTGVGSALGARMATDLGPWGKVHWTGSKVVTFGIGTNAPSCSIDSAQMYLALRYDPATLVWTRLPPLVQPHYSATSLMVGNNRLVAWGGTSNGNPLGTGAIYRFDTNIWTPMATAGAPVARSGSLVAAIGDEAVILGGDCGWGECRTGARFNALTNAWRASALPPPEDGPPGPRAYAATVGNGTQGFVWGGVSTEGPRVDYRDGAVYDAVTDTWRLTVMSGNMTTRMHAFGGYAGGRFFVWGGIDPGTSLPRGDGMLYDPVADTWDFMATPPMDLARYGAATVWDGTGMIVWGGYHNTNSGSLWHEDTRTGPLSADLEVVAVRQLGQSPLSSDVDISRLEVTLA
ncbi:MAG: Kelch repeat-containing protein, partial [Arenimonas sp.]